MKLKKVLTTLMIVASMSLTSQAAFAAENESEIGTYVSGIGDTKANAISLMPQESGNNLYQDFELYLSSSTDQDWFKWTNNTGQNKFLGAYLSGKGNECAFRLGFQIKYSETKGSGLLYADYLGPGNSQSIENIIIPPGATVYIKIDSTKYVMEQYTFNFRLYPY